MPRPSRRPRRRGWGAAAAVALALGPAGCGGGDGRGPPGEAGPAGTGGGGALTYVLARDPATLDPLLASGRGALLVTRQLHEPLVARLAAPLGDARPRRGLATSWSASADRQVWIFRLRRRVRFQDGRPLNAAAVAVNATRWATLAAGRRLLPGLRTADAPRGTLVRLVFDRAVPDLPRRLASPRLGIVSPGALRPRDGARARLARSIDSGSGPFELRERRPGKQLTLARSDTWWGSRYGLGPALDQIELRFAARESERVEMLRRGEVLAADDLGPAAARLVRRDPLLAVAGGAGGRAVGFERSVRGLGGAAAVEPLSGVWLTRVGGSGE